MSIAVYSHKTKNLLVLVGSLLQYVNILILHLPAVVIKIGHVQHIKGCIYFSCLHLDNKVETKALSHVYKASTPPFIGLKAVKALKELLSVERSPK